MTSQVDNLAIKVDKLDNRVGGLDIRVDNVSKQVDEFSTKLEEFATNLTDFMKKTNTNSDTILTVVELFKKHALQVRDIEREITGINESVDERFETVDELSKKFKKVVDLVERNSRHIEGLSGKIKKKGKESVAETGDSVKPILESDTDFKEDEEPTARMMELVGSVNIKTEGVASIISKGGGVGPNNEFVIWQHVAEQQFINVYDSEGKFLRNIGKRPDNNTYYPPGSNYLTYPYLNHGHVYYFGVNNDKIYIRTQGYNEDSIQVFSINGQYLQTIDNKQKYSLSNNGILLKFNFKPIDRGVNGVNLKNLYNSNQKDGLLVDQCPTSNLVTVGKNGDVFVIDINPFIKDYRVQVFNSDGLFLRKFHIYDNSDYGNYKSGSDFQILVSENEIFILQNSKYICINVYNLYGKFLYRFRPRKFYDKNSSVDIKMLLSQSDELYICCYYNDKYGQVNNFTEFQLYKRGIEYVQRPLERKYRIYSHSEVEKEINELDERKVKSVSFPLSIYQKYNLQPQIHGHNYTNLLTNTIYFQKPQSVKKAIKACEEYFNGPVTKSDFQDLQSGCLLAYVEGVFASRELNWATCNYNRLCRGYFLGGNVLSGVKITEDDGLVLDITQD